MKNEIECHVEDATTTSESNKHLKNLGNRIAKMEVGRVVGVTIKSERLKGHATHHCEFENTRSKIEVPNLGCRQNNLFVRKLKNEATPIFVIPLMNNDDSLIHRLKSKYSNPE
jgi:hypothetical protein